MQAAEESGQFTYVPMTLPLQDDKQPGVQTADDDDNVDDGRLSPAPETDFVSQTTVRTAAAATNAIFGRVFWVLDLPWS